MTNKKKKVRVELRKNRTKPPRENDLTQQFGDDADAAGDAAGGERVRAKGVLSRHRTVLVGECLGPGRKIAPLNGFEGSSGNLRPLRSMRAAGPLRPEPAGHSTSAAVPQQEPRQSAPKSSPPGGPSNVAQKRAYVADDLPVLKK